MVIFVTSNASQVLGADCSVVQVWWPYELIRVSGIHTCNTLMVAAVCHSC
jgi:hypothetical protein